MFKSQDYAYFFVSILWIVYAVLDAHIGNYKIYGLPLDLLMVVINSLVMLRVYHRRKYEASI